MARQMRSLDSYLEEAKGMILKWGSLWMLKDDQILGQVASAIMRAENDHNPEHDSGATVVTLRVTYGRREIWNVYRKQNSIMKRVFTTLLMQRLKTLTVLPLLMLLKIRANTS